MGGGGCRTFEVWGLTVKGLGCRIRLRFLSIHTVDDINPAIPIFRSIP